MADPFWRKRPGLRDPQPSTFRWNKFDEMRVPSQQEKFPNRKAPIQTIPVGSPMTQPMISPNPPQGTTTMPSSSLRGLIKGQRYMQPGGERFSLNPDVVHSYNQPFTAQMDNAYGRGQSIRRLTETRNANWPQPVPPPQPTPAATAGRMTPPAQGGMPAMQSAPQLAGTPGSPTGSRPPMAGGQPSILAGLVNRQTAGAPGVAQSQPPSTLPSQFNTPYYQQRVARQAAGQGSPFKGMAATTGAAPVAPRPAPQQTQFVSTDAGQQPSQNPLTEPMGNPMAAMRRPSGQGLQSLTNPTEFAKYTAAGGTKPLMVYSGSGREGPLNKLPMARNREEMNARQNRLGEGGMTFDQAVADRANFNKDGRFFQGAKLSEQNGRPVFVSDEKPTFAGGEVNEADAAGNRLAGLLRMQKQGKGYVTPDNKFVGMAGAGGGEAGAANASLLRDVPNALARRIPQGVEIGNSPTSEQMAANKAGMLARLQARKDKAQAIRTERAQAMELARRNAPSPQMQAMLAQNPELALRFMEAQQRGQALQGQLGNQQAALALEARKVDQEGQIARAGLEFKASDSKAERDAKAAGQAELIAAEQKKQADMIAAQQAQQQGNLQFQSKEGEANRANAKDVAGIQAKAAADRIAADERAKKDAADAALTKAVMDDPNMTLEQKQQMLADRQQQTAGPGPAAVVGVGGAAPRTATGLASARTFAGGTLKEAEHKQLKEMIANDASAEEVLAKLRTIDGMKGDTEEDKARLNIALNELMPPTAMNNVVNSLVVPTGLFRKMMGKNYVGRYRTVDDPSGISNQFWSGHEVNPKTGKPYPSLWERLKARADTAQ